MPIPPLPRAPRATDMVEHCFSLILEYFQKEARPYQFKTITTKVAQTGRRRAAQLNNSLDREE
jgi:hypothetical protein